MALLGALLSLLTLWPATFAASAQQPVLFHGTSVIIIPSNETSSPANSTLLAANFFCYMGDQGYFSFGWWVNPTLSSNTSHCVPDSPRFHWYEFASKQSCDPEAGTCLYSTQNKAVREPHHAAPLPLPHDRKLRYVIKPVNVGNHGYGQMAVSWIDDGEVKVYGVGTRQVLSGGGDEKTRIDCRKAMHTLREVYERYGPVLPMEVDWGLCGGGGGVVPAGEGGIGLVTQKGMGENGKPELRDL
ncbi:hypothetical protein N658DRAFT_225247 [Parathielavia hyrcaniae]|uniref:Uncharacterized protein n=1 Tax=Parathielavia hyrcaniae TaxID=113614 RepID=A0AAN6PUR6_9PEZI|nr:hypothetical protein N658DRAFT_225247 [Parathielavia hyrcaniae]